METKRRKNRGEGELERLNPKSKMKRTTNPQSAIPARHRSRSGEAGGRNPKSIRRFLILAWVVIFFSLFLCIIFGEKGAIDLYHLKSESDHLAGVNDALKKENQGLYRNVERLKNDPEYIEEVAREEFGMVARDEIIYQFKGKEEEKRKK